MTAQQFISAMAPIIVAEAKKRGYKTCAGVIAQCCIESGWGRSSLAAVHHNYFGMKAGITWRGSRVVYKTKEEYTKGKLTTIKAAFRSYATAEEGIAGYYDFISAGRYSNLKTAVSAEDYLRKIKADGYATSSTYVETNMNVVRKYGLEKWDAVLKGSAPAAAVPAKEAAPAPAKTTAAGLPVPEVKTVQTGSGYLTVREKPNDGAKIIGKIPDGAAVAAVPAGKDWAAVQYASLVGYAASRYLN